MTKKLFTISNLIICWSLVIVIWSLFFVTGSLASEQTTKNYDGVWFLGFNMHKDIFGGTNGTKVRKAFNIAINQEWIVENILKDDVVPVGIIPPGMLGHNPNLTPYSNDLSEAKKLMTEAGYPVNDKRIKQLTMLHTDGEKTVEIAKWIKRYLINLGVDLQLVEVSYTDQAAWENNLKSGQYHMFLMGYKGVLFNQIFVGNKDDKTFHDIDCPKFPSAEAQVFFGSYDEAAASGFRPCEICKPKKNEDVNGLSLLDPLFHSEGGANLTFYNNSRVDSLLNQIGEVSPVLKSTIEQKLQEIEKILHDDPPVIPIFYITRL